MIFWSIGQPGSRFLKCAEGARLKAIQKFTTRSTCPVFVETVNFSMI